MLYFEGEPDKAQDEGTPETPDGGGDDADSSDAGGGADAGGGEHAKLAEKPEPAGQPA